MSKKVGILIWLGLLLLGCESTQSQKSASSLLDTPSPNKQESPTVSIDQSVSTHKAFEKIPFQEGKPIPKKAIQFLVQNSNNFFHEFEDKSLKGTLKDQWMVFVASVAEDIYGYQEDGYNEEEFWNIIRTNCQGCTKEMNDFIQKFLSDVRNAALLNGQIEPLSSKQNKNIIDYYQSLYKAGLINYPLFPKKAGWVSKSSTNQEIKAIVDLRYGYIKISEEKAGDASSTVEVLLLQKSKKRPLMVISETKLDGVTESGKISFQEMRKSGWKDVGKDIFPTIKGEDLLLQTRKTQYADKSAILDQLIWKYQLSRKKSDIHVIPSLQHVSALCQGKEETAENIPTVQYCNLQRHILPKGFVLSWNKSSQKFSRNY